MGVPCRVLHTVPFGYALRLQPDSVHVAPFWHGLLEHSSTSWHAVPLPVQPTRHVQLCEPGPRCAHVACSGSQSSSSRRQLFTWTVQLLPCHPRLHVHDQRSTPCVHVAPC